MADLTARTTYELQNSPHSPKTRIPCIGFGVFRAVGGTSTIQTSLQAGYRQLDTAQMYGNEEEVGRVAVSCGIPRNELFITTKVLAPVEGEMEATLKNLRESVEKCSGGVPHGYVDLFLIHSPSCGPAARKTLWLALEQLRDEGKTKEIGVSNYGIKHLQELLSYARHPPAVHQIELHPWCQQPAVAAFCVSHGILLQAYAPLVRGRKMDDATLVQVAQAHGVGPAQVLVRWCLQHNFVPLPKSDNPGRITLNIDVFGWALTPEEMQSLDRLGDGLEDGQGAICPYLVNVP